MDSVNYIEFIFLIDGLTTMECPPTESNLDELLAVNLNYN